MTTTRIFRVLAIAAALALPVGVVGALPAQAADHFRVDTDSVVLRNTASSNPIFTGSMESWHDGTNTRATLTGSFTGRGYVRVTFTFHDNSTQTASVYTAGVQQNVSITSVGGRTVVRHAVRYEPNSDESCPTGTWANPATGFCDTSAPPASRTSANYVGDSPQSYGNCNLLDDDDMSMQGTASAVFFGHATYGCTTTGRIVAHVRGTLNWTSSTTGTSGGLTVTFFYADGTSEFFFAHQVYATSQTSNVAIDSSSTKNVRFVQVTVSKDQAQAATGTGRFGDA
jgi:hypothetical protein